MKFTRNIFWIPIYGIVACLTLLAPTRVARLLFSVGENLPTSDSWRSFVVIVAPVLDGTYQWKKFFGDVFINGHLQIFTVIWQILLSYIFHYDLFWVLLFGLVFSLLKLIMLFDLLTLKFEGRRKWLLLPGLSFLVFSATLLSTFEFDWNTLMAGTSQLGFVIGLWGLVRFPNTWKAIILAGIGGLFASWSSGSGPLAWPVYFLALILLGFRGMKFYLALILVGTFATFPYIYFIFLQPSSSLNSSIQSFPQLDFLLGSIGAPLSRNFTPAGSVKIGTIGIVIFALVCFQIAKLSWGKRKLPQKCVPALLITLYGILTILQIFLLRNYWVPWYAFFFMPFWWGVLGFLFFLLQKSNQTIGRSIISTLLILLNLLSLSTIVYFVFMSNLDFENKSFFLRTRSPVAASCLRNYNTAPTYCDETLFVWGAGNFNEFTHMALGLERNSLSVFGPKQQWFLQGDFILPRVKLNEMPNIPDIFWASGVTVQRVSFLDYRRLNLFLHSPNSVEWTVSLPKNLQSAHFVSAVGMSHAVTFSPEANGMVFQISQRSQGSREILLLSQYIPPLQKKWLPFQIDLTQYAGQEITLILKSDPLKNTFNDWGMLLDPHINLTLSKSSTSPGQINAIKPSNTDLSKPATGSGPEDFTLGPVLSGVWDIKDAISDKDGNWKVGVNSTFRNRGSLDICLADYSHLALNIRTFLPKSLGFLKIAFLYGDNSQGLITRNLTLLGDGEPHEYTYDLKLLEIPRHLRLKAVTLEASGADGKKVNISQVRFIKKPIKFSYCP